MQIYTIHPSFSLALNGLLQFATDKDPVYAGARTINNSPGRLALPPVSSGLAADSIFLLELSHLAGKLISIMANIFVTVKPPWCLRILQGHPTTVSS